VASVIEELLKKYDLYHSSIISLGNVKFNINYLPGEKIYISLVLSYCGKEQKYSLDVDNSDDFKNIYLAKIVERFLSKNVKVNVRTIMGNATQGTLIIQRHDLKDYPVIYRPLAKKMNYSFPKEFFSHHFEELQRAKITAHKGPIYILSYDWPMITHGPVLEKFGLQGKWEDCQAFQTWFYFSDMPLALCRVHKIEK
jgi:hypothetical protein